MSHGHPFQKICCFRQKDALGRTILLAATGPRICTFDIIAGELLSCWPESEEECDTGVDQDDSERPSKRQKFADTRKDSDESVEIVAERAKGARRKPKVISSKQPNVSHLVTTGDGSHVVAVTTDDKCIRVLSVDEAGRLHTQSERSMPKRLCAITLTADTQSLIAGDKFGDVYSLPLYPTQDWTPTQLTNRTPDYKPSASELTVHTKGNLEALRQQQLLLQRKPKKEGPDFEHKLLLGHVSLLTDVVVAETTVDGRSRQYILSADRDEHIRVSRGIPQAHVIENYCHGHKEFITKLCIVPWASHMLLVGSGEPTLSMYNWRDGELVQQIPYHERIREALAATGITLPAERSFDRLVISRLWTVGPACAMENDPSPRFVLLAVEGFPLLLSFRWLSGNSLQHHQSISLTFNVLDVAVVPVQAGMEDDVVILVSTDTIHVPASVNAYVDIPEPRYFQTFRLIASSSGGWEWCQHPLAESINASVQRTPNSMGQFEPVGESPAKGTKSTSGQQRTQQTNRRYSLLGEFLYGLENLRKKRGQEADEAEKEAEADDVDV